MKNSWNRTRSLFNKIGLVVTLPYTVVAALWGDAQSSCQLGTAGFLTIISWLFFCATFSEEEKYRDT